MDEPRATIKAPTATELTRHDLERTPADVRVAPMAEASDAVQRQVDRLAVLLEQLEDRAGPVLSPYMTATLVDESVPEAERSSIVNFTWRSAHALDALNNRLTDIIARIEV